MHGGAAAAVPEAGPGRLSAEEEGGSVQPDGQHVRGPAAEGDNGQQTPAHPMAKRPKGPGLGWMTGEGEAWAKGRVGCHRLGEGARHVGRPAPGPLPGGSYVQRG